MSKRGPQARRCCTLAWGVLAWGVLAWCAQRCDAGGDRACPAQGRAGYRQEVLVEGQGMIASIYVHWNSNTLYFSHFGRQNATVYALNIENKSRRVVGKLPHRMCWVAVQQRFGRLYVGCWGRNSDGGLYVLDSNVGAFVRLDDRTQDVYRVRFGDALYYTDADYNLQVHSRGRSRPMTALQDRRVWVFAVRSDGGIAFQDHDRLYYQSPNTTEPTEFSFESLCSPTVDARDDVFCCTMDAIYRVDTARGATSRLAGTVGCEELATDRDGNFIYRRYNGAIFRLIKC